jgi:hypothetical protein
VTVFVWWVVGLGLSIVRGVGGVHLSLRWVLVWERHKAVSSGGYGSGLCLYGLQGCVRIVDQLASCLAAQIVQSDACELKESIEQLDADVLGCPCHMVAYISMGLGCWSRVGQCWVPVPVSPCPNHSYLTQPRAPLMVAPPHFEGGNSHF